ncbi:MAG: hypothetical protein KR126chlam1_00397 [Chlamydiae bacterium]|nr:hypothetical protein [Chlamydiota bacterium]
MVKFFFSIFCLLFLTVSTQSFSQPEAKPDQTVEQTENGGDLFDVGEAPITYKGAFLKMMFTLLGLIALIVISVWMLRRVSQGKMKQMNYGRSIKVIERRPLSAKSVLYLIEIDGKRVVIAESQVEVRPITIIEHSSLPEES